MKLKNRITQDIVICENIDDKTVTDYYTFVRVYHEGHPERTFLVNLAAYDVISEKSTTQTK
jgi:hypothetical protein